MRNRERVLSPDQLLDLAWDSSRRRNRQQGKLYIAYLRRKLRQVTDSDPIETVRGYGYRYRGGDD